MTATVHSPVGALTTPKVALAGVICKYLRYTNVTVRSKWHTFS